VTRRMEEEEEKGMVDRGGDYHCEKHCI